MQDAPEIGKEYYDTSQYYEQGKKVFTNLQSPFQKYRIANIKKIYPVGKTERVLDLGCGWGTFCFALATSCHEITGVDFSRKSISLCQETLAGKPHKNIKFHCANARNTGLSSQSFDVIIAADLLEHCYPDQTDQIMDECKRLLKPGGKLVIWTPHRGHFLEILKNHNIILKKDASHVDYKSMSRITALLNDRNFLIKKNYYGPSHFPVLKTLERLTLSWLPIMRRRILILAEKPRL